jgi:hypothetical protein
VRIRLSIDRHLASLGLCLLSADTVVAWLAFTPPTYPWMIGVPSALLGLPVVIAALAVGVRRWRFGRAPTHLRDDDVLLLACAGWGGLPASALVWHEGVHADVVTAALVAFTLACWGPIAWVLGRVVGYARPLRAQPS